MRSEMLKPIAGRETWIDLGHTALRVNEIIKQGIETGEKRNSDEQTLERGTKFLNKVLEGGVWLPSKTGEEKPKSTDRAASQAFALACAALNDDQITTKYYENLESTINTYKNVLEDTISGNEIDNEAKVKTQEFFQKTWERSAEAFKRDNPQH